MVILAGMVPRTASSVPSALRHWLINHSCPKETPFSVLNSASKLLSQGMCMVYVMCVHVSVCPCVRMCVCVCVCVYTLMSVLCARMCLCVYVRACCVHMDAHLYVAVYKITILHC